MLTLLLSCGAVLGAGAPGASPAPAPAPALRAHVEFSSALSFDDPLEALVPERPWAWAPVLRGIARKEIKATSKVQGALVQCMAVYSHGHFEQLLPAVQVVGSSLKNELKVGLKKGAFKGVSLREDRLIRAALLLGKSGRQLVEEHLERSPVSMAAMEGVRKAPDVEVALKLMLPLLMSDVDRAVALRGLRRMAQTRGLEEREVRPIIEALKEPWSLAAKDLALGIDAKRDRARISEWLAGDDPVLAECAAWCVGRIGSPLIDLAPALSQCASEGRADGLRFTACWALGSLAEPGPTCTASLVHIAPRPSGLAIGGGRGSRRPDEELLTWAMLLSMDAAREGRIPPLMFRPSDGNNTLEARQDRSKRYWRFIASWLDQEEGATSPGAGPDGVSDGVPDTAPSEPSATPDSGAKLPDAASSAIAAALSSSDQVTRLAALAAALAWELDVEGLIECAAKEVGGPNLWSEQNAALLTFLEGRVDELAPFVAALAVPRTPGRIPDVRHAALLSGQANKEASEGLLRLMVEGDQVWSTGHVRLIHRLDEEHLSKEIRKQLDVAIGERFLRGDVAVAPLLARRGTGAHPILRQILKEGELPHKMVAAAILEAAGASSRPLLEDLAQVSARSYWKDFIQEVIESIEAQ